MVAISADRNPQKILMPPPDLNHIYDACNATEGAESTRPFFHFILLKLRLARFYELLHKSY